MKKTIYFYSNIFVLVLVLLLIGNFFSPTTKGEDGACDDPGIGNVYKNTNYNIDGVSKTGTLQRACYSTGAKELGTTGNFCGDDQGTAVAGDICNSVKAWVDGSLKTGNRTACSSSGYSLGVPKTGQTTSYATYDDGYFEKGQALSYTDNGDGTIIDNNTGLMWKRCAEPDTQTSGCTGTHSTYLWQAAINQCEGLTYGETGYWDWRLPNAKELWSITSLEPSTAPYINQTAFPGTGSLVYWTSTTYYNATSSALSVSFETGSLNEESKTSVPYSVRCVRPTEGVM